MIATGKRARELFVAALRLAPEQWDDFLRDECGDDTALHDRARELLRAHVESGSFLDGPAIPLDQAKLTESPGTVIGPYKLLEQIGEGGMGLVFMAEQTEPIRRKVALKIIKPGMDTRQVVARFEAERQALAMMDHPNIAKILDAGTVGEPAAQARDESKSLARAAGSRPFFVMELVRGVPITEFCDQHRFTPRQRLALFITVCQAVQHAHQKGIIHRDLKPSNILVTLHDTLVVPKIIDFGIAKATEQPLTNQTLFTNFAQLIGTPQYMSPEQAEMNSLDIDTRSDVYSLGVLLYELLTGTTPFDSEKLKQAGFDEMRRLIREEDPPRPSQRISTLEAAALTTLTERRGVDGRRFGQSLRGELDWVVMKALEKDRNRRYDSASALAADVQRYLDDEPIEAKPPGWRGKVAKWGRRHRGLIATAVALLSFSCAAFAISSWLLWHKEKQTQSAREQADERFQYAREVIKEMYSWSNWESYQSDPELDETQRRFLQKALDFYQRFAAETMTTPELRCERGNAFNMIAVISTQLGENRDVPSINQAALDVFEELVREFPRNAEYRAGLAQAHMSLAHRYLGRTSSVNDPKKSLMHVRASIQLREQLAEEFPLSRKYRADLASSVQTLGQVLGRAGQPNLSKPAYERAVSGWETLLAEEPSAQRRHTLAGGLDSLAQHHLGEKQHDEALNLLKRAIELSTSAVSEAPTNRQFRRFLAAHYTKLAIVLVNLKRLPDAEAAIREGIVHRQKLASDYPSNVANWTVLADDQQKLLSLLYQQSRLADLEPTARQELESRRQVLLHSKSPTTNQWIGLANANARLGLALKKVDKIGQALQPELEAVDIYKQILSETFGTSPDVRCDLGCALHNLALTEYELGETAAAIQLLDEAMKQQQLAFQAKPTNKRIRGYLRNHHVALASCLCSVPDNPLEDYGRALALAKRAVELDVKYAPAYESRALAYLRLGEPNAAISDSHLALSLKSTDPARTWLVLSLAYQQIGDLFWPALYFAAANHRIETEKPNESGVKRIRSEAALALGLNPDF